LTHLYPFRSEETTVTDRPYNQQSFVDFNWIHFYLTKKRWRIWSVINTIVICDIWLPRY